MFTMAQSSDKQYLVRHNKRTIGFIQFIGAAGLPGGAGWRFLANKRDVAQRIPSPAPVFTTADAAFVDLKTRLV